MCEKKKYSLYKHKSEVKKRLIFSCGFLMIRIKVAIKSSICFLKMGSEEEVQLLEAEKVSEI